MSKEAKKLAGASEVLRAYGRVALRYPRFLSVNLLGVFMVQAGRVFAPLYLSYFITRVSQSDLSAFDTVYLLTPLIAYGLLELLSWVGHRVEMWAGIILTSRVMADLTREAFHGLIRHSHQFFSNSFAGALTRRVTRYSDSFDRLYDSITLALLPAFIYIIGIIAVLSSRNWVLGVSLVGWVAFFIAIQWVLIRWQQPLRRKRAEEDTNTTAALADSISNHPTVQLFAGRRFEEGIVGEAVRKLHQARYRMWMFDWWVQAGLGLLGIGINVFLLVLAFYFWRTGVLTVGDFVLIQIYVLRLLEQVWGLGREFRVIYTSIADAGEMVYTLNEPHDIVDATDAKELAVTEGRIKFAQVNFFFHEEASVLEELTLTVKGGERIALVGPSGAGKSTITKLLLRLYDVQSGTISIDEHDIAKVTQDSLREAVAFVPQEPILFHRSIMENIRYGRRGASDEEVFAAAKAAHCHEFISRLSHGYQTYVGERGVKLSGGERQRVAIARAILKNAPILILDEATSSLDSESEALIQDALETLMQGKTVLVIAHRLSTIMKMDRIIVLQRGKIVAEGTHRELLNEGGLYQKLWNIQAGGFMVEDAVHGERE